MRSPVSVVASVVCPVTTSVPLCVALPEVSVPKLTVCAKRLVDEATEEKSEVVVALVNSVAPLSVVDDRDEEARMLLKVEEKVPEMVVEPVTASVPVVVAPVRVRNPPL